MENYQELDTIPEKKQYSFSDATQIGNALGISWATFGLEQFTIALNVELERAREEQATEITRDEPIQCGMLALAHLNENPDYYAEEEGLEQITDHRVKGPRKTGRSWGVQPKERNTEGKVLSAIIFAAMFGLKAWKAYRSLTSVTAGLRHRTLLR